MINRWLGDHAYESRFAKLSGYADSKFKIGCQNEQWSFCGSVLQRQKAEEGEGGWGLGVGALVFGDDLMTGGKKGRKKTEQVGHDGGK